MTSPIPTDAYYHHHMRILHAAAVTFSSPTLMFLQPGNDVANGAVSKTAKRRVKQPFNLFALMTVY